MRTSTKITIAIGAVLLLGGGGIALYLARQDAPTLYWTPTIRQETPDSVLAEGAVPRRK